ncbi:hypothetical protein ACH5RR_015198 [Cinchona calisaya]|uniref:Uncharacterized protein n=1 Tax=Cinchona calisaya TaxID=153742 RepID=A0ABD2ZT92_9GENT
MEDLVNQTVGAATAEVQENQEDPFKRLPDDTIVSYFFCQKLFSLLEKWVPVLPESLQNVVITDSRKQGKLDLGEDDVVALRNGDTYFGGLEGITRFWQSPLLKLPLSGCVMKMVTLLICKGKDTDYDDFLIVKQAFGGKGEEVFVEAASELLKKEAVLEI